jgi:hypothetical protein
MNTWLGTAIFSAAALPWIVEVFFQLRLQARFLEALPASARAALPRHPRRPVLAFLGSARFQLAVWRSFRRDRDDDLSQVRALKRRMRISLRREIAWALTFLGTLIALLATGWRPFWP